MVLTTLGLVLCITLLKLSSAPLLGHARPHGPSPSVMRQSAVPKPAAGMNTLSSGTTTCAQFPLAKQRLGVAEWTPETIHAYYANLTLDDTLASQLRRYAARVEERRRSGDTKRLWDPYDSVNIESCLTSAPECSFFLWQDKALLMMGDPSSRFQFLYRKCCIEHHRLQVAVRCAIEIMSRCKELVWWAGFGTLLAMMREPGVMIPWDTDVDLFMEESESVTGCVTDQITDVNRVPLGCTATFVPRTAGDATHAHGKKFALIYGSSHVIDERDSRVELWIRDESKKSQRADIVFPLVQCGETLYRHHLPCPRQAHAVLNASYGPRWCKYCKHSTSACKLSPA